MVTNRRINKQIKTIDCSAVSYTHLDVYKRQTKSQQEAIATTNRDTDIPQDQKFRWLWIGNNLISETRS